MTHRFRGERFRGLWILDRGVAECGFEGAFDEHGLGLAEFGGSDAGSFEQVGIEAVADGFSRHEPASYRNVLREGRMAERTLDEQEMINILEQLARDGSNGAARIAALKMLREIDAGEKPADDEFAALDELAPRRAHG